jgi:hypothetical protein
MGRALNMIVLHDVEKQHHCVLLAYEGGGTEHGIGSLTIEYSCLSTIKVHIYADAAR